MPGKQRTAPEQKIDKMKEIIQSYYDQAKVQVNNNQNTNNNLTYEMGYDVVSAWVNKKRNKNGILVNFSADDVIHLAHLIYAWMPRCLHLHGDREAAQNIANMVVRGVPEFTDVEIIKDFIDNSYIAASKFLHFLYPRDYAIWDSRVHAAIQSVNKEAVINKVNDENNFCNYQQAMRGCV